MKNREISEVHQAVMINDVPALEAALTRKFSVDGIDRAGRTALFYAAKNGNLEIVKILFANGATLNAPDENLETPLHFAVRGHKVEIAKFLLEKGASVDVQNNNGNTPLSVAVFESKGKGEMIELLIRFSANKFLKNKHGVSPEDLARSIGNHDVSRFLGE